MIGIEFTDDSVTFTSKERSITLRDGAYERLVRAAESGTLETLSDFWTAVNMMSQDVEKGKAASGS